MFSTTDWIITGSALGGSILIAVIVGASIKIYKAQKNKPRNPLVERDGLINSASQQWLHQ